MSNIKNGSTTIVKIVCAIIFLLFTFSYVYFFQANLLEMIQFAWSEGVTTYEPLMGGIIITLTLGLLALVVSLFVKLPQRCHALIYFPSLLALGLLTAVKITADGSVVTSPLWLIVSILLIVAYVPLVVSLKQFTPFLLPLRSTDFLSQPWWTNLMCLFIMFSGVYTMGNTNRSLHTCLALEHYVKVKDWDKALEYGIPQHDDLSYTTMMRMIALGNKGLLGEKLFNYRITEVPTFHNNFSLSYGYRLWQTLGFVPADQTHDPIRTLTSAIRQNEERMALHLVPVTVEDSIDTKKAKDTGKKIEEKTIMKCDSTFKPVVKDAAKDFLLCYYLMERKLPEFMKTLPKYYDDFETMPKHYREAYVLYKKVFQQTNSLGIDALRTEEADFTDFMELQRKYKDKIQKDAAMRDNFFGTYWCYYYSNICN